MTRRRLCIACTQFWCDEGQCHCPDCLAARTHVKKIAPLVDINEHLRAAGINPAQAAAYLDGAAP